MLNNDQQSSKFKDNFQIKFITGNRKGTNYLEIWEKVLLYDTIRQTNLTAFLHF